MWADRLLLMLNGEKMIIGRVTVADIAEAVAAVVAVIVTFSILFKWG